MSEEILDTRKVVSGKDGRIFVTIKDKTYFLAEASAFTSALNVTNADVQPMGSLLIYGVTTGVSIALTATEIVIRDDVMITPIIEALQEGYLPTYDFQGVITRPYDGAESRQTYRNCIPDGTINLMTLTPGEVVQREWAFRGNATPEMIKELNA